MDVKLTGVGDASLAESMRNSAKLDQSAKRIQQRSDRNLTADEKKKLRQACEDFESIFVNMMLRTMRDSVSKAKLIHGGHGEDLFQGMMDEEVSKEVAKSKQLGLGQVLYQQLTRYVDDTGDSK